MKDEKHLEILSLQLRQCLAGSGKTLTCAESCTGGWIAKVITDISGSSAYFHRGFVTYSNEAKHQMIGVSEQSLQLFGAVSEQVVTEMAIGALNRANADFALSVSGIAGPDGGSLEKPVGTVWFGFAQRTVNGDISMSAESCLFPGDRYAVRLQSVIYSLKAILKKIDKKSLDTV